MPILAPRPMTPSTGRMSSVDSDSERPISDSHLSTFQPVRSSKEQFLRRPSSYAQANRKAARGLHDRLNRISHFDVNVSNLERSRARYEATTPLRAFSKTVCHQAFPSLGISRGRFEGYLLKNP